MSTAAPDPLGSAVQASWRRFLDTYEPLRPELFRYCRHLARSPWDAEDLVQEARELGVPSRTQGYRPAPADRELS